MVSLFLHWRLGSVEEAVTVPLLFRAQKYIGLGVAAMALTAPKKAITPTIRVTAPLFRSALRVERLIICPRTSPDRSPPGN
jgi:hypothetical protein